MPSEGTRRPIDRLLEVMARLRDPKGGCPWDLKQDHRSLIPYLIEECYEVVDAIERGDEDHLKEELGDLLLQIVFHCQIARERGAFDFDAVASEIAEKLIRRHPHVFAGLKLEGDEERQRLWEEIKRREKGREDRGALDGVLEKLPALMAAERLQRKAAEFGFDWPESEPIFDQIAEELSELREVSREGKRHKIEEELGDLLFSVVNLARKLGIDPETALRKGCRQFKSRFHQLERALQAQGRSLKETSLQEFDRLWEEVKRGFS